MKREIKFRAKRIDMDRWVYGQYFITPLTDENSGTTPDSGWFFLTGETRHCIVQNGVSFVIDPKTLGQYTGLKDKNGKEIYEEDLWLPTGCETPRIVRWCKNGYWFHYPSNGNPTRLIEWAEDGEVIGNTYQNPELLAVMDS